MKTRIIMSVPFAIIGILLAGGCVPRTQYDKCVLQNDHCNERLEQLLAEQQNQQLEAERWKQKYELLGGLQQADKNKVAALEASLAAKKALIDQLTAQLSQPVLPIELSNALSDWAAKTGSELVEYDEKKGIVRFKSDLLFNKGEDTVQSEPRAQLESLSKILNSAVAEGFDIQIVGHTDDIPILKPGTLAKHRSNWHLSAHRAIAVENVLEQAGIKPTRLSVTGMGEYRHIQPNEPNQRGNPRNRRVEIYIVPAGRVNITNQSS